MSMFSSKGKAKGGKRQKREKNMEKAKIRGK